MNYVKKSRKYLQTFLIMPPGDGGFVFYRDRDDWRDVTPIAQNDGPVPVVLIAYSDRWIPHFSVVMALKSFLVAGSQMSMITSAQS